MSTFQTTVLQQKTLDPSKRVRYSTGLVLGVDEFRQEQTYFMERDRRANRSLHGYGTVSGLRVFTRSQDGRLEVVVTPGMAVDPHGRTICIPTAQCADVNAWLAEQTDQLLPEIGSPPVTLEAALVLCYQECETDYVPIPGDPCRSEDDSKAASRIADDFRLTLIPDLPGSPPSIPENGDGTADEATIPEHTEEAAILRLGDLLESLEVTGEATEYLTKEALSDLVRGLAETAPSGSPPESTAIHPADAEDFLRTAFRIWATEVRPALMSDDRCRSVPEDDQCVVLARVQLGVELTDGDLTVSESGGTADLQILEDDRPLLLSTRVLQEWMYAFFGHPFALSGEPGLSPPESIPESGGTSPSLEPITETGLQRITALSWTHATPSEGIVNVELQGGTTARGIVVAFGQNSPGDGKVLVRDGSLDPQTFQVSVTRPDGLGFWLERGVRPTRVIPVEPKLDSANLIVGAAELPSEFASAGAFLIDEDTLKNIGNEQIRVMIRGDFVMDGTGRAIDAEFVRGELPTGAGPFGHTRGIQGGIFESWFERILERLNINTATVDDFRTLPRIGPELAKRIVDYRTQVGGFNSVEDLVEVSGIGSALLDDIRPFIFLPNQ